MLVTTFGFGSTKQPEIGGPWEYSCGTPVAAEAGGGGADGGAAAWWRGAPHHHHYHHHHQQHHDSNNRSHGVALDGEPPRAAAASDGEPNLDAAWSWVPARELPDFHRGDTRPRHIYGVASATNHISRHHIRIGVFVRLPLHLPL